MRTVSGHPSQRHIDKLRAEHQAQAESAAESGLVPKAFHGDPTFQELVCTKTIILPAPTAEFYHDVLVGAKIDESTNDSG